MTTKRSGWVALLATLMVTAGCSDGPKTGEVFGTVTVDGQVPMDGSSINFVPADGKSPSAGCTVIGGRYSATVPVGMAKVEIRAPRPIGGKPKPVPKGGYQAEGQLVEETLPAKYNDSTELTFEVKSGKTEKNWDLKSK